ncbi:hypothetical protein [Fimbriimonas ginsengisoli]|uniref:Lipoprotein n=1 Tax=Fimbriimonas ginsengisoli Gsoil 348 TaxID=661478 RepID=A0A068NTD7_FIMGI|nr:hypothetical protein [Fimbriimonas ginsengisoli]AIE86025.1 hypothetical protein OP10G_2657 [Fimbriimonas ginsengisoli Gsoil 348]
MKFRLYAAIPIVSLLMVGCQSSSTPQAAAEVKKELLGRKPTAEEISKAMGNANARMQQTRGSAGK